MGAHGGPNMTEDGVVFYYDTGNSKSYVGEPTENLVTQPFNILDSFSNGSGISRNSGSNLNFTGQNNAGTIAWDGVNANWCAYITSKTSGVKYTTSWYLKAGTASSIGVGWGGAHQGSKPSFDFDLSTGVSTNVSVGSDFYKVEQVANGFYKLSLSSTLTSTNYFPEIVVGESGYVIFGGIQIEQKSHATPFVNGTRSVTEGLKDFTGNSTIDLTNVSFDSNAQVDFDGTNDYVSVGDSAIFNFTSALTIELWTYVTSFDTGGCMFICQQNGATYGGFEFWSQTSGTIRFNSNSSDNIAVSPSGTFELNKWQHLVCTADGTTGKIYVNGELVATNSTGLPDNVNGDLRIGDWPLAGYRVNGSIPVVKMYSRALTAEEVAENFNGVRSRFGI